ncbi:MAG: 1,4-alpha-glucan branching protein GlgB [Firmicutes bacterium]|nr:1,4-alpha-glucan branching protein GlgB [Bacillota bacterium]
MKSLLSAQDLHLFNEGTHYRIYDKLGAHLLSIDGVSGAYFAVWAPNAREVHVMGDFNHWDRKAHSLQIQGDSGIWTGFIPGVHPGTLYKYSIISHYHQQKLEKTDPVGFYQEVPPRTASIVWNLEYQWKDKDWLEKRRESDYLHSPVSIYEVHLGSWRKAIEKDPSSLTYRELAHQLAEYVKKMGFTHVELMPVMEHPFDGSWGYQVTGYFAPTSRYGTPQDFMYFVDYLHQNGIGVILDWVPSHFPTDGHGLGLFDGTHLYEHADPKQGFHPDWKSFIFNYGRNEVKSFLMSSALFWLDKYHIDGLRVDAVASMLYLDYSRKEGEWIPNEHGGRENINAIRFLQKLNEEVYRCYPGAQTTAEESTAWPMVSQPVYLGGLGFGFKWDMGWMHDTLQYMKKDPVYRKHHHHEITFRMLYAFHENFVLPLSHDEVVHGKGSLIGKMPGDDWQKFANLRLLYGYMFGQPGKKLLFMGGEFGQWKEWNHAESLDWNLLEYPLHSGLQKWVSDLNQIYRRESALYELDSDPSGFEWGDCQDWEQSILSFLRKSKDGKRLTAVVCNFTPVPRIGYRIGVPLSGMWKEVLNSDAECYGGSNLGNGGGVMAEELPAHGKPFSLTLILPPLGVLFFEKVSRPDFSI